MNAQNLSPLVKEMMRDLHACAQTFKDVDSKFQATLSYPWGNRFEWLCVARRTALEAWQRVYWRAQAAFTYAIPSHLRPPRK